ncbi:hypothetical protein JCM11491_001214 [Sporobolomyces phaffii]
MLSLVTSVPSSLAASTWSFFSNRKKTFAYLGATVGGAYAVGQWGLQRMLEASERGRKHTGAKNDLLNRFNLNLHDAQFTVQALLPTVATQLQASLDVEQRTAELGEIAKAEKMARLRDLEQSRRLEEEARAEAERASAREDEEGREGEEKAAETQDEAEGQANGNEHPPAQETTTTTTTTTTTNGIDNHEEPPTEPKLLPTSTKLTLNPAAPAFQPRFASPSPPPQADFPRLNGHDPATESPQVEVGPPKADGSEKATSDDGEADGTLGKSWAEVVKTTRESESAENGQAETTENGLDENKEREASGLVEETSPPIASHEEKSSESSQDEPSDPSPAGPAPDEPESPPHPTKTKVQLWNEIKILSFTRLLTSIYVLSLLTLQTHVQLALLGRAHYVKSLVDALPSSSASFDSPSEAEKGKGKGRAAVEPLPSHEDDDLEAALYRAKELPTREEDRVSEDVERKYLTFSWWLLHEGWKVVRDRVEEKVEEVVGPMGLKTPVVYGELSALLGEIRKKIETHPDGSRFDFSAALHPPTAADERHTLVTGGGFADPASGAPSSSASTALVPPPLRSLLNETSDFLLSPDGSLVLTLLLDRLLSLSISKLEPAFTTPLPNTSSPLAAADGARGARFEDVTEKQTRLASLLPVLTRLSAAGLEGQAGILRGSHGNEFIEAIDDVRELKEFVAIVYASYDRDNLRASY